MWHRLGLWGFGGGVQGPKKGRTEEGGCSPELPILHLDPELLPFIRVHIVPLRGAVDRKVMPGAGGH